MRLVWEYWVDMPLEEQTRKSSRKELIMKSKADIDYDQLQEGRRETDISERQLGGNEISTGMPFSGTDGESF